MIKQVVLGTALLVALASVPVSLYAKTNKDTSPSGDKKVFVCKYVGKPHVDERLKDGKNPISVSVNAIQNNQWDGATIPAWFSDAQDRSYVLAADNGQETPNVNECPAPEVPDDTPTDETRKVFICHYTPGQNDKYELIEVSVNAADKNPSLQGHEAHEKDLIGDRYADGCPTNDEETGTPDEGEPGKGDLEPETPGQNPTPVTATRTTQTTEAQPAADVLPYTAGDHTFAITLIAAGLATIAAGLGIGIKALYRRSA